MNKKKLSVYKFRLFPITFASQFPQMSNKNISSSSFNSFEITEIEITKVTNETIIQQTKKKCIFFFNYNNFFKIG